MVSFHLYGWKMSAAGSYVMEAATLPEMEKRRRAYRNCEGKGIKKL